MDDHVPIDLLSTYRQTDSLLAVYFHAEWTEACREFKEIMSRLFRHKKTQDDRNIYWFLVDVDDPSSNLILDEFGVESIPTVIFIDRGQIETKIEEFDPARLYSAFSSHSGHILETEPTMPISSSPSPKIFEELHNLINSSTVMIFIKGSPLSPKCGFTRNLVQLLESRGISFNYFDVLQDNQVRNELKTYSKWDTYPQVYAKGEFVGGLDVARGMMETGEWEELFI